MRHGERGGGGQESADFQVDPPENAKVSRRQWMGDAARAVGGVGLTAAFGAEALALDPQKKTGKKQEASSQPELGRSVESVAVRGADVAAADIIKTNINSYLGPGSVSGKDALTLEFVRASMGPERENKLQTQGRMEADNRIDRTIDMAQRIPVGNGKIAEATRIGISIFGPKAKNKAKETAHEVVGRPSGTVTISYHCQAGKPREKSAPSEVVLEYERDPSSNTYYFKTIRENGVLRTIQSSASFNPQRGGRVEEYAKTVLVKQAVGLAKLGISGTVLSQELMHLKTALQQGRSSMPPSARFGRKPEDQLLPPVRGQRPRDGAGADQADPGRDNEAPRRQNTTNRDELKELYRKRYPNKQ